MFSNEIFQILPIFIRVAFKCKLSYIFTIYKTDGPRRGDYCVTFFYYYYTARLFACYEFIPAVAPARSSFKKPLVIGNFRGIPRVFIMLFYINFSRVYPPRSLIPRRSPRRSYSKCFRALHYHVENPTVEGRCDDAIDRKAGARRIPFRPIYYYHPCLKKKKKNGGEMHFIRYIFPVMYNNKLHIYLYVKHPRCRHCRNVAKKKLKKICFRLEISTRRRVKI